MYTLNKNFSTGLFTLQVGVKTFESESGISFNTTLNEIEKVACSDLPHKITFLVFIPELGIELDVAQVNSKITQISFSEESDPASWEKKITGQYFFELKEKFLLSHKDFNPTINFHNGNHGSVFFGFSIQLEATTTGEAIKNALEINKSFDDKINHAIKIASNSIQIVLGGGFQIKLPPNVFPGKKDDNNSSV